MIHRHLFRLARHPPGRLLTARSGGAGRRAGALAYRPAAVGRHRADRPCQRNGAGAGRRWPIPTSTAAPASPCTRRWLRQHHHHPARWQAFLHIGSPVPMKSDHVPIFFDLTENGQRSVRQATLWLTPDPNPAPPPPAAPRRRPVPAPMPVAAPVIAASRGRAVPCQRRRRRCCRSSAARHSCRAGRRAPFRVPPRAAAAPACACSPRPQIGDLRRPRRQECRAERPHRRTGRKGQALSAAMQAQGRARRCDAAGSVKPRRRSRCRRNWCRWARAAQKPRAPTPWLFIGIVAAIILALAGGLAYAAASAAKARNSSARHKVAGKPRAAAGAAADGFIASVKSRLMPGKEAAPEPEAEPARSTVAASM